MSTKFEGRTFDRLPMMYDHRRFLLRDFITDEMRHKAATLTEKIWDFNTPQMLDQGNYGHCEGFAWANFGICVPVVDGFTDADGHRIYYESVARGGQPGSEGGSTTEWGAQAMQKDEKRIATYAFASSTDDLITWLLTQGPSVVGTNWYSSMSYPDATGLIQVDGTVVGGHAWLIRGVSLALGLLYATNSWSERWGLGGHFTIPIPGFRRLHDEYGDACMAVELPFTPDPTPTPVPDGCLPKQIARFIRK